MNNMESVAPRLEESGRQSFGSRYGSKIALICAMGVILMICAGFIWGFAYDRERDSETVSDDIAREWGQAVAIIDVDFIVAGESGRKAVGLDSVACRADIQSEVLHRNIYQAEVYKATIDLSGVIGGNAGQLPDSIPATDATFRVDLDATSVIETGEVTVAGSKFPLKRSGDHLTASIPLELVAAGNQFEASFKVRGSKEFSFYPRVEKNSLTISGNSLSPSFQGSSLPIDRTVGQNGFTSTWQNIPVEVDRESIKVYDSGDDSYCSVDVCSNGAGVDFVIGMDSYRKVVRAIKYAFLIILLTFVTVFATEVFSRRNIPVLNYFLIGAALVVFYLLLLSIAEFLAFGYAYLIAAVMTVGLICVYLRTMLNSPRLALYNALFLSVLYGCCYVMLCVSVYALLIGSLMLFAALAITMNVSLRLQRRGA